MRHGKWHSVVVTSYYRGEIEKIVSESTTNVSGEPTPVQQLLVKIKDEKGNVSQVTVRHGQIYTISNDEKLTEGQSVIVSASDGPSGIVFNVYDVDRTTPLLVLCGLLIGVVVWLTKKRGVGALIGLGITLATLTYMIVPLVVRGYSPALVSLGGAVIIASTSLFLAHGFKKTTFLAWVSTIATLLLATGLAAVSIYYLRMTGSASEETLYLTIGGFENIELKGLLLGGMIIGTLGVLDDVTTAQVSAVMELKNANRRISKSQLRHHAMQIGKEHILAVVNTLILAYAGGALPLFIIFTVSGEIPVWVLLNGELLVEEIVRTLIGSIALVLAVPITTLLAVHVIHKVEDSEILEAGLHKH